MNIVIGNMVLPALPHDDPMGVPVDLTVMVDMVIHNRVLPVNVLGAWTIANQEDSSATKVIDLIVDDPVVLTVEIQTHCCGTAVGEFTLLYGALLRSAQANKRVTFVDHLPVVLDGHVAFLHNTTISMRQCQTLENDTTHRCIRRAI